MSDKEPPVDVLLRWKPTDSGTRRDTAGDSVLLDLGGGSPPEVELEARQVEKGAHGEECSEQSESNDDVDGQESFEWSADREQAIIDALEYAPAGAVPRVQQQLNTIASALEASELPPERAAQLLREIDEYLAGRVATEQRKAPVTDAAFVQSRSDKLNALAAYQEATDALREYSAKQESVQLKVARYAADQGGTFMLSARETLLSAEPDDDFEDEDYEDEDLENESEQDSK